MMNRTRKYRFVTSPFFLGLFLFLYYLSAFFIPFKSSETLIPSLIGFLDIESIPVPLSVFLGAVFLVLTAISLYLFNERNLLIGESVIVLPLIYLIFAISSPQAIYFSGASVASLFIVWSIYYSLFSRKGDKELFICGFLISTATMFDPSSTLLIPLILFFSLRSTTLTARSALIVSVSVLIPFAFMFSLRYLIFQDAMFLLEIYINDLKSIYLPSLDLNNFADIIKIITLLTYLWLAVRYALLNISRFKILKSHSFLRFISMLFLTGLIMLLYPQSGEALTQIIAIPVSVLILEYVSSTEKPTRKRVGFILILIFLTMSRIAAFI